MRVLAIVPAYNEEASIVSTITMLQDTVPEIDYVVVNDGSRDTTSQLCAEHGFNLLDLPVNLGLTGAFQTGMKYAHQHNYDAAIQFDADGQHDAGSVRALVACMEETGCNIVIGSRFVTEHRGWSARMVGSRLITVAIRMTTGAWVKDPTSGMRLYDRKMIEQFANGYDFEPEPDTLAYFIRRGAKVKEVQAVMFERKGGQSYLTLGKSVMYMTRVLMSTLFIQWFR